MKNRESLQKNLRLLLQQQKQWFLWKIFTDHISRTRATIAKEKGLEPLAQFIYAQEATEDVEVKAAEFISDEEGKEVATAQDAIAGALDIIAEQISDVADYRTYIRDITMKEGKLVVTAKDEKAESVYENYYNYSEALSTIPGHRIHAINRGEDEKFLTVKVEDAY